MPAQSWQWTRDDLYLNPSGLDLTYAASWAWGDLDRDGLIDVLIRQQGNPGDARLHFYRNANSETPPYWIEAPEVLNGFPEPSFESPVTIADFDGDGFPNLITLEQDSTNRWQILAWNQNASGGWEADTTDFCECELAWHTFPVAPFFGDADGDFDLDAIVEAPALFGKIGLRYFENVGSVHNPMWREDSSRLALVYEAPLMCYEAFSPILIHADQDSLIDLVIACVVEGIYSVEVYPGIQDSTGMRWGSNPRTLFGVDGQIIQLLPASFSNEAENLLVLESKSARLYLRSNVPNVAFDPQYFRLGAMNFQLTSSAIPFDYENDGQVDLLAFGHRYGWLGAQTSIQPVQQEYFQQLKLWQNTNWPNLFLRSGEVLDYKAQLVDLDRNGYMDFVAAAEPYLFMAWENSDSAFQAEWQMRPELLGHLGHFYASQEDTLHFDPAFADLDGDEDLDLLLLMKRGRRIYPTPLKYVLLENQLHGDSIVWKVRNDWFTGLEDTTHSHSNFVDLDYDGDQDLVFATKQGGLLAYENAGDRSRPNWREWPEVFTGVETGRGANPSFGDIDHDGRPDLFVGNSSGELFLFRNDTRLNVSDHGSAIPQRAHLYQNFPNPFNARTVIRYEIPHAVYVQLVIYDLLGRPVATLVNQHQNAGGYEVIWDAGANPSGVYLVRLSLGKSAFRTERILMIR